MQRKKNAASCKNMRELEAFFSRRLLRVVLRTVRGLRGVGKALGALQRRSHSVADEV